MIAGKTVWAFLLALVLGCGIWSWDVMHPDECYRYLQGQPGAMATQNVEIGGETVPVPCEDWYPRQTLAVQMVCVVEGAACVVFLMLGMGDFVSWIRVRKGGRRLEE